MARTCFVTGKRLKIAFSWDFSTVSNRSIEFEINRLAYLFFCA